MMKYEIYIYIWWRWRRCEGGGGGGVGMEGGGEESMYEKGKGEVGSNVGVKKRGDSKTKRLERPELI